MGCSERVFIRPSQIIGEGDPPFLHAVVEGQRSMTVLKKSSAVCNSKLYCEKHSH